MKYNLLGEPNVQCSIGIQDHSVATAKYSNRQPASHQHLKKELHLCI